MHKMDDTPRIITIVGLCLEGLMVFGFIITIIFFNVFSDSSAFSAETLELTQADFNELMEFFNIIVGVMYFVLAVYFVIFVVNLLLFIPLIKGNCTIEKARKVYLYQIIWGAINLLSNTLVGVLYLVSGVQGRSGHREEKDIRDGI